MKPPDNAALVVLPGAVPKETVLLGLTLEERIIKAAQRAGFGQICFGEGRAGGRRTVLLSGSVLPKVDWLRRLAQMDVEPENLHAVGEHAAVVVTQHPEAFALDRLPPRGADPAIEDPAVNGRFVLSGVSDLPRAEKWLLDGLVKEEEGFMSRHVERRISLAISRRLAATSISPNAMTLVSVAVGLAGAALFLSPRAALQFAGALLFLAHSILDGCDGELARLKFQESRLGGVLDFWGDNVVHVAVFAAIAAGWAASSGRLYPVAFGAAAILGTICSAGFVYLQTMARARKEGPLFTSVTRNASTRLSRMADLLARRDFIYLVVVLAAFGKARWFLVGAAFGAPLFFFTLLALAYGKRENLAGSLA